jgi:hypothetical protein
MFFLPCETLTCVRALPRGRLMSTPVFAVRRSAARGSLRIGTRGSHSRSFADAHTSVTNVLCENVIVHQNMLSIVASDVTIANLTVRYPRCTAAATGTPCTALHVESPSYDASARGLSLSNLSFDCSGDSPPAALDVPQLVFGVNATVTDVLVAGCGGGLSITAPTVAAVLKRGDATTLVVRNLRVSDCRRPVGHSCDPGTAGGALRVIGGFPLHVELVDTVLERNDAQTGGAIHLQRAQQADAVAPSLTLRRVVLRGNSARCAFCSGGAVSVLDAELAVYNAVFDSNFAGSAAGAIYALVRRHADEILPSVPLCALPCPLSHCDDPRRRRAGQLLSGGARQRVFGKRGNQQRHGRGAAQRTDRARRCAGIPARRAGATA